MLTVNNEATSDQYAKNVTLESLLGGRLVYVVANNSVIAQFKPLLERGGSEHAEYGSEILLPPQTGTIDKIAGARFKSAVAGQPGRIIAQLSEPGDILPAAGTPFTSLVAASGGVTTFVPGKSLTYNEVTVSPGLIAPTTEATAVSLVASSSFTYDGATPVLIEGYFPLAESEENFAASVLLTFVLWDDTANVSLGQIGRVELANNAGANTFEGVPVHLERRLTPVAGARVYSIRAFAGVTNRARVSCDVGGVGKLVPGFITIHADS